MNFVQLLVQPEIDKVKAQITAAGATPLQLVRGPSLEFSGQDAFKLTWERGAKRGTAIITVDSLRGTVLEVTGLPQGEDGGNQLQRVPAAKGKRSRTNGDKAVEANDSDKRIGAAGVAAPDRGQAVAAKQSVLIRINEASTRVLGEGRDLRSYIGASGIGDECVAYQSLSLRGFPNEQASDRAFRIFRDGHEIETRVVKHLKDAGFRVEEIDPATQEQWEAMTYGGHVVAHLDGKIWVDELGPEPLLLEVKSMNEKRFNAFKGKGVKVSDPKYYSQVVMGMGLTKMTRSFFIVYNKNTSEMEIEIVDFYEPHYHELLARAAEAMTGKPKRISSYPDSWACKYCFKRGACWDGAVPGDKHCRQCKHAVPNPAGEGKQWICKKHGGAVAAVCGDFAYFKVQSA